MTEKYSKYFLIFLADDDKRNSVETSGLNKSNNGFTNSICWKTYWFTVKYIYIHGIYKTYLNV